MGKHLKKPDVNMSLCGQTGHMVEYTNNMNEVTCARCIKSATTVTYDMKQRERRIKRMADKLKRTSATLVFLLTVTGIFLSCADTDKNCYGTFECVGGVLVCQGSKSGWSFNPGYVTNKKCKKDIEVTDERGDNIPEYAPTKQTP